MWNIFKKQQRTTYKEVLTGRVRFVNEDKISNGTIFGEPHKNSLVGNIDYYYVVEDDSGTVHEVASYKIERGN